MANAEPVEKRELIFAQLKKAHNTLKQTQAQFVQQEKKAGLGRLVFGVAHVSNTPSGSSITASFHGLRN
ncbi:hypothetical protein L1286_02965 [Pseudoalteromonas sp. SMS1]|uniref:hypothetical protein n=1 Tax=Pseudoalteromonas sp. SMS1 TaxID=2908894 RepID=UPI001F15F77A|nr:hypothetical protein [Pseudoalteromonas sp. SMS1]MCF2856419.1 hypothetical protein [Pseudoalteromonas sp. SMS1]